jgi:hypothetical protein
MQPFLIFLVILGLAIIFISYFVSERYVSNQDNTSEILSLHELTDEGRKFMLQNVDKVFKESAEEIIVKVDDELSQISNEKIIAVSEYSDQILDKIKHNHEEVVFMYHMLTEKENELKGLVKELNEVNASLKNGKIDTSSLNKYSDKITNTQVKESIYNDKSDTITNESLTQEFPTSQTSNPSLDNPSKANRRKKRNSKPTKSNQISNMNTQNQYNVQNNTKDIDPQLNKEINLYEDSEQNNNDTILRLYKEGKSIVEIAKYLDLGQGEVKLVIDLFQGE